MQTPARDCGRQRQSLTCDPPQGSPDTPQRAGQKRHVYLKRWLALRFLGVPHTCYNFFNHKHFHSRMITVDMVHFDPTMMMLVKTTS